VQRARAPAGGAARDDGELCGEGRGAVTIEVRHASASGRLDEAWQFFKADARLDVLTRRGSRPLALALYVCSADRPMLGAHPIQRVSGDTWRVLPARFTPVYSMQQMRLMAVPCAIGGELAPGEHLILNQAPDFVSLELECL
jgi:hypothetical protein